MIESLSAGYAHMRVHFEETKEQLHYGWWYLLLLKRGQVHDAELVEPEDLSEVRSRK
jgi:hypothetical protein